MGSAPGWGRATSGPVDEQRQGSTANSAYIPGPGVETSAVDAGARCARSGALPAAQIEPDACAGPSAKFGADSGWTDWEARIEGGELW